MGAYTHKGLMSKLFCRRCRFCENAKRKNVAVKPHKCVQNYPTDQSSKSMEAAAILDMAIHSAAQMKFVVSTIVSDDDSTMRAHLRHKVDPNNDKDKGKLPPWVPEPKFLADPSH